MLEIVVVRGGAFWYNTATAKHFTLGALVYRTITLGSWAAGQLGSCVAVQGLFLKSLANGMIAIKVGNRIFKGMPIESYSK